MEFPKRIMPCLNEGSDIVLLGFLLSDSILKSVFCLF